MATSRVPLPELTPEQAAESNTERILAVAGTFHAIALLFVGVRLYTRFILIKAPRLDDAFMIVATIGAFGGMLCFILGSQHGLGRHRQTIEQDDFLQFRRYSWVYSVSCAVIAYSVLKISIVLSLLPLSRARWYMWTLWGLLGFIVAYTIVAVCSFLFHCRPMAGSWNPTLGASCYDISLFVAFSIMNTAFNMFSDVVCATLPIPIIWTLNMKLRTRLYLCVILSLGYATVAMGVAKCIFQFALPNSADQMFEYSIQFYGFLQVNLGIIVACAPTLRPLLGRALKLSTRDNYYENYYGPNRSNNTAARSRRSRMGDNAAFELEDNARFDNEGGMHTTIQAGRAITIYDKEERSGSEELILQSNSHKAGIMRTTEIEVR
ncbi:hypothetical protein B0I35DRAFT_475460 [Stachybotrys elegans]|uniref:Rhodopsin domain-containing protein n=1 Tax=Stachybotrys elegans TaxID=80388 RepID=A0A8K0SYD7_9HYPO|nr:hypothetical protein B0I35DRAFT_475460 [Stachybotrys elegans]